MKGDYVKMKVTKERAKGITLISLVITIIILLILAGITIVQLTGSGLFEKSKLAKVYSREAEAEEKVNLEIIRVQIEKEGTATLNDIYNDFSSGDNKEINVIEVIKDTTDTNKIREIVVSVSRYEEFNFTIGEDLSITEICGIPKNEWKGETLDTVDDNKEDKVSIYNSEKLTEGTTITINAKQSSKIKKVDVEIGNVNVYSEEILNKKIYIKTINLKEMQNIEDLEFNKSYTTKVKITLSNGNNIEENGTDILDYTISDAQDLKELANQVNNENKTFEEETILQIADIDLGENSNSSNWNPIGYLKGYNDYVASINETDHLSFKGTFDGNNHTINNMNINATAIENEVYCGIGFIAVLEGGTVKNLNFINSNIYSEIRSTGIAVGYSIGNSTIENVKIINGEITIKNAIVGGVCGYNAINSKVINCYNNSNITQYDAGRSGGICGENYQSSTIENCYNTGIIDSKYTYAGGICGENYTNSIIESCYNTGTITVSGTHKIHKDSNVGGIVADNTNSSIINCYNAGNITGAFDKVGGIVGYNHKESKIVKNVFNNGVIKKGEIVAKDNIEGNLSNYLGTLIGLNDGESITGKNENTTIDEMKNWNEATILENLGSNFKKNKDINLNNGLPILKWQQNSQMQDENTQN